MGPETLALFIPILALSIPIVAIIAGTFKKKYKMGSGMAQASDFLELKAKVKSLEETVARLSGNIEQIEDKQNFVSRLLEDKSR